MSLLANVISEVLPEDDERSRLTSRESKGKQVSQKSKVIAACTGAVVTSLTMTPFDVIKTRLQTQSPPESLFVPSSRLPPSVTPWPIPVASTSTAISSIPTARTSTAASNLATCCQKTYFTSNVADSLLCRFDPRISTSALPAAGSHLASHAVHSPFGKSVARSFAPISRPLPSSIHTSTCAYPTPAAAILSLPSQSQPSSSRHLSGFWDAVVKIVRHEGLSAMWRGTGPALAMSVPGQVVYMVGYDWGRRNAFEHAPSWAYVPLRSATVGLRAEEPRLRTAYLTAVPLIAGSISRTCVAALVSPIELLRTRLQSSSKGTTIPAVFRQLQAAGGWTSAWRGLPPTLWRDVPFSGIYWAGYEGIKRTLTDGKGMGESREDQGAWEEFAIAFVSGAGSGMLAATLTNPFDVVKTRRQALDTPVLSASGVKSKPASTKTFTLLLEIANKEGWPGLMRGLTPRLMKSVPACGLMVGCYELGKYLD